MQSGSCMPRKGSLMSIMVTNRDSLPIDLREIFRRPFKRIWCTFCSTKAVSRIDICVLIVVFVEVVFKGMIQSNRIFWKSARRSLMHILQIGRPLHIWFSKWSACMSRLYASTPSAYWVEKVVWSCLLFADALLPAIMIEVIRQWHL